MRLLVLIFFLLNLNFSFSQKVREEIMLIVDSISSSNSINDIDYIETDFKFNDLKSFIELKNKATFNELIELSNADNKLIRYFSLIALVDLKYEKLDYLFNFRENKKLQQQFVYKYLGILIKRLLRLFIKNIFAYLLYFILDFFKNIK